MWPGPGIREGAVAADALSLRRSRPAVGRIDWRRWGLVTTDCGILRPVPIALVTGSGIRLGRAIALELARSGHDLALHAHRSRGPVEALAREIESLGRRVTIHLADLGTDDGPEGLASEVATAHPTLDVLVNNAGLFEAVPFEQLDRARWRRMQAVNLEAPAFLTRALLPALRRSDAPCVVNITDIGGERPYPGYTHYSVSKAGLLMLTRALAVELAPAIRVNAVSPGTAVFPEDFDDAMRAALLERIPLKREGSAEDIAKAVRFLVQDAPYVTGQVVNVDGGRSSVL